MTALRCLKAAAAAATVAAATAQDKAFDCGPTVALRLKLSHSLENPCKLVLDQPMQIRKISLTQQPQFIVQPLLQFELTLSQLRLKQLCRGKPVEKLLLLTVYVSKTKLLLVDTLNFMFKLQALDL